MRQNLIFMWGSVFLRSRYRIMKNGRRQDQEGGDQADALGQDPGQRNQDRLLRLVDVNQSGAEPDGETFEPEDRRRKEAQAFCSGSRQHQQHGDQTAQKDCEKCRKKALRIIGKSCM